MDTSIKAGEVQEWSGLQGKTALQGGVEKTGVRERTSGMEDRRRPISREERLKMQKRRKRMLKKKRRRRFLRIGFTGILLTGILIMVVKLTGSVFSLFISNPEIGREGGKYEVGTPQILEKDEIQGKLRELAEQYPEFVEIYENADAYPESLLAALCNNPEMIDFVKGYLTADGTVTGGLTKKECSGGIPLLLQWDQRWGYVNYGDNDIARSGCAPTCLSMVIVGLTGNADAAPDMVAEYAMENGYYVEGTGTAWSLMTEGGSRYGIRGREISLSEGTVYSELEAGNPIICSMRQGDFTTLGHFIVLTGIEDGRIKVNDPNSRARSSRLWDYETLEYQISNLWAFNKD